ncbi:MAG: hypothetical protein LUF85_06570 [Bacteroides sp.]|nr:hypothetical protein [Bacteroides sp.]
MKFKTKALLMLARAAKIELAEQVLDDVTLYFLDGDELVEGTEVFDMNEAGEYVAFPDGSYSWGNQVVVVENSVVQSLEPKEGNEEKMQDESDPEGDEPSPNEVRTIVKIVRQLIEEVEKLGGNVGDVKEELKLTKQELAQAKAELKLAKGRSNGRFAEPNPRRKGTRGFASGSTEAELAKFGIK